MLQIAFYLSCGATVCYLWSRSSKREADSFSNITRVVDFKRLDDLLKEKASNLLVVVSGKVASAAPFNCKHDNDSSTSGEVFEAKFGMGYETKLEDDGSGWITYSGNFLYQVKQSPWYLEDSTGLVKVVGAEFTEGFTDALTPHFDMSLIEFLARIVEPRQGSKAIYRASLDIGTCLTIIGEAARDAAGNLTIQKPNEHSFRIFSGEGSFDKMIADLKLDSEFYIICTKIFGSIALAIFVMKGVRFIRRVLRERAENAADSDSEETP